MGINETFRLAIYWLLFFLICLGLGYPTLNRVDVQRACVDSIGYFETVTGTPAHPEDRGLFGTRVLVPWVARPFYWLSRGRIGSWDPVAFGMLVSNSLFTATGALLLLLLGEKHTITHSTALIGTLLYFLNPTIPNRQLGCGLVESGESLFMMALFWAVFEHRLFLLPMVGLLGALAKESFVPLAALGITFWGIAEYRTGRWKLSHTFWAASMILIGLATTVVLQFMSTAHFLWPWEYAGTLRERDVSLLRGFMRCLTDRYFWYVFGWLLPLGVVRLGTFPRTWLYGSLGGVAAALAMGAWNDAAGNTVPSIFNSIGTILSLSAASLLSEWQLGRGKNHTSQSAEKC